MSRPKPNIIMEFHDIRTNKSEQILEAGAIYSVYYNKRPINLRTLPTYSDFPGPKYQKVSFSNPGHAFNLAERLNKRFKTDLFEVARLSVGEFIVEEDLKTSK